MKSRASYGKSCFLCCTLRRTFLHRLLGNIVFVDYKLSSWKYQEKECRPSPYVKYITGELPLPENSGIIIKRGYLISTDKGMGSAYGAQWKPNPNKPKDMALKGTANTVQRIYISTKKGGYWIQVKYGEG